MLNLKNKTLTISIALLLAFSIIAWPIAANVPTHHKSTHAYVGATPNPIGVGQETLRTTKHLPTN